ncbi:hypothetical protein [Bacillus velezensis]|uniref:hypothetical protein n=1 Tax=Bacillus velezensis TaxID=492670 RepID=UPI003784B361
MGTKKYVRIKKASVDGVWYADRIGQIFEVERLNSVSVLTNRGVHGESSVLVEDVEFIFTEKRKAEVGEKVLILDDFNEPRYMLHDVVPVIGGGDEHGVAVRKSGEWPIFLNNEQYEVIVNSEIKNEEADEMKIDLNAMGYDELMAHGDAVLEAIKKRTFQEGFRAAKQVQRKLAKMNAEKSAQARRDEIVEQAKADAEELVMDNTSEWCGIDFIVNRNKRTVVALIKGEYTSEVFARGIAKAAPNDCFNVHIGKAIALRRALGLKVPDEYLNAPQPTEVRVGDVVGTPYGRGPYKLKKRHFSEIDLTYLNRCKIIDDSREEVGE